MSTSFQTQSSSGASPRRHRFSRRQEGLRMACGLASAALLSLASAGQAEESVPQQRVRQSLHAVMQANPLAHAQWRLGQPAPSLITGLSIPTSGITPEDRAQNFVEAHAALIGLPADQLNAVEVHAGDGRFTVRFQQVYQGMPVYHRDLILTQDVDGNVILINNSTLPIQNLASSTLSLSRAAALTAFAAKRNTEQASTSAPQRVVIAEPGHAVEAALVHVARAKSLQTAEVLVDLSTGKMRSVRMGVQR